MNELYEVECLSVNNYAKGVAKIDSLLVFVDDFYPGEKALISIVKKEKNFAYGKVEKLLVKSPRRIDKVCDHIDSGTCPFNDIDYDFELEIKKSMVKSNIERALKITLPDFNVTSGDIIHGYRNKVTVFFKKEGNEVFYGTFKEETNDFVKINSCVQIDESINRALKETCLLLSKYNLNIFDYKSKKGYLKGITIRKSFYTGKMSLMFLSRSNDYKLKDVSMDLIKTFDSISGISVDVDESSDTFIYSGKEYQLLGSPYIDEKILDVIFSVNNMSFLQVNSSCASKLYKKAIELMDIKKNEIVLDLYSGCGGISLNAAKYAKEVIGIETVNPAVESAKKNAKYNKINNASFYKADALKFDEYIKDKDIKKVFVDPPRSGMDKKVVESLIAHKFERIVYVSCDSYTMARDLKMLSPYYDLKFIECFNMFPRTKHVETVALLDRVHK